MTDDTDLEAACAVAEDIFQRGDIARGRALADEVLATARARGDRGAEARALQLIGEIEYDELAYGKALEQLAAAVAIREELLGPEAFLTRYGRACRSVILSGEDRNDEADAELARALPASGVPASPEEAAAQVRLWVTLGGALHSRDRNAEARRVFEALLAATEGPTSACATSSATRPPSAGSSPSSPGSIAWIRRPSTRSRPCSTCSARAT
jgi:tetratricopeptide (TPR) repeat protein